MRANTGVWDRTFECDSVDISFRGQILIFENILSAGAYTYIRKLVRYDELKFTVLVAPKDILVVTFGTFTVKILVNNFNSTLTAICS